jgi:hypothetical protein
MAALLVKTALEVFLNQGRVLRNVSPVWVRAYKPRVRPGSRDSSTCNNTAHSIVTKESRGVNRARVTQAEVSLGRRGQLRTKLIVSLCYT